MKVYKSINKLTDFANFKGNDLSGLLTILAHERKNYAQPLSDIQQKRITGVYQPDVKLSNAEAPISISFKDTSIIRLAVKNGQQGEVGRQGKQGPEGNKGANADIDTLRSKNWLIIANDTITDDNKKVLSALQGVKMSEAINALSETYLSDYQYALLFTDHVFIETEFETIEDGQVVQLIASDPDSHKRYVKYWTFESEGEQEYFILNHYASKPDAPSYDSVYCDLWEDIFLGGQYGYFEASTNQVNDGTPLYIKNERTGEYVLIEQYNEESTDLVYGEKRFNYVLPNTNLKMKVVYTLANGYEFDLDATELTLNIYLFDSIVDGERTYKLVSKDEVNPNGVDIYYKKESDGSYSEIDNVAAYIERKAIRYFKHNDDLWYEVEDETSIDTEKYEDYVTIQYTKSTNTHTVTRYNHIITVRGEEYYEVKNDIISPYTITYYIYDDDRQYYTRRIIRNIDADGNVSFDYEYTRITIPFWLEAEFITETEDMQIRILSSDTKYESDIEEVAPVYIESIEFEEGDVVIAKNMNKNVPLNIFPLNANQTGMFIEYDENVIEFYEDGRIGAIENDDITLDTKIRVYAEHDNSIEDTLNIKVVTPVERIDFESTQLNIYPGNSAKLKWNIVPEKVSNPNIWFNTTDNSMISISSDGTVTPKTHNGETTMGTCQIIARAEDGFGAETIIDVLIANPIKNVSIISRNFAFVGKQYQLETSIYPDDATEQTLEYSSSDTNIIEIDAYGHCKPKAVGSCELTVRTKDGSNLIATQTVDVSVGVDNIEFIDFDFDTLDIGLTKDVYFKVNPLNAHNNGVTIIVSDENVISYTEPEYLSDNIYRTSITALKNGNTQFAVQAVDGTGSIVHKEINITIPAENITLNYAEITMYTGGDMIVLRPIIGPSNATVQTVSWHSSKDTVATVDAQGRVTPHMTGVAIISAISNDGNGVVASCKVTVKQKVETITLNNGISNTIMLTKGNYGFITASVTPDNATEQILRWTSSNNDIVVVEQNGTIFGKNVGEATITVTSTDLGDSPATTSILVKVVK